MYIVYTQLEHSLRKTVVKFDPPRLTSDTTSVSATIRVSFYKLEKYTVPVYFPSPIPTILYTMKQSHPSTLDYEVLFRDSKDNKSSNLTMVSGRIS